MQAEQKDDDQPNGKGHPEASGAFGEPKRQIGADHVKAAVGQVEHPEDAEDQGQPAGEQEEQQPVLNPVEELNEQFHLSPGTLLYIVIILQPRAGSSSALCATPTTLFSLPTTLRR